jgi:hypothetical protein
MRYYQSCVTNDHNLFLVFAAVIAAAKPIGLVLLQESAVGADDSQKKQTRQSEHRRHGHRHFSHSFEQHVTSHADILFKEKLSALANLRDDTYEVGYEMLWKGVAED